MVLILTFLVWPSPLLAAGGPGGVGSDGGDSDLRLWLRADKGVYADPACLSPANVGVAVACWSDQSGYGLDVTQADPGLQPVYRSTKLLEFDTDVLTGTQPVQLFATPNSGLSVIIAFKSGVYTQTSVLMNYGSSAALDVDRNLELGYTFGGEGDFGLHRGGGNATVAATTRITAEQPYIFSTVVLTSGLVPTTSVRLYLNGTPAALTALAGGWLTSGTYPTTTVPLDIGARRDGNLPAYPDVAPDAFHKGDISEVIVFTTPLNTAQQTIIENYLSAKYTIPLNVAATKYVHSAYIYDVIGIGKEADGMHTEARGAGLILENGGYLRDVGDYLMAGHRTVVNVWTNASLPAGVSSRWERNWYFDKTDVGDNGGAITLKFDFSEGDIEGEPNGIYVLLGRSGTGGRFRVVQASSYIEGDQVIFPNVVALKDGWSYTLGQASDQYYFLEDSQQPGGPAFNFEDISATGTEIVFSPLVDNGMSGALPLGFSFNFYDVNYSNVYLSTEGFITFLPGQQPSSGTAVPIPTNDVHNGLIAGWWNDLDQRYGGKFYYETRGTAPNRRFIVQYHALPLVGPGGVTSTFQIKLFESSNIIEVHYLNAQTQVNTYALGGIENQSGTSGLQYYYGDANIANLAVRYSRPLFLLEQMVNDPTPRIGDRITYTLILRSNFPVATTEAVVSDTLDAGLVFATEAITVTPPQTFNQLLQGQILRLDGFTLGAGQRITFTIPVTVNTDVVMGDPLLNTALLMHPALSAPRTSEVSIVPDNCWVNLNGAISDQVQPMLDLAAPGDEVKVAGYCLDLSAQWEGVEQVAYISKTLTLRGGYTPADWTTAYPTVTTVLDARGQGRVVFVAPGVTVTLANLYLINGDAFQSGSTQSYGGGVYAANAQLSVQDVQLYDNTALLGGGVYVSGGMLNWTRGAAMTNTASTSGGGIYLTDGVTVWLNGVVLRANGLENSLSTGQGGAGLYALNSTLVLTGQVQLYANTGAYQGGGIYVQNTPLTAQQLIVRENGADRGGGMFVSGGTAQLSDLDVRDNYTWGRSGHGGGLYFLQSSAQISMSQLVSNTANGIGGAIYADRTNVLLVSSVISHNFSQLEGGGVYANNVVSMTLRDNDIVNNRGASGAGLYVNTGTPNLSNNRFVGNQTFVSGNGGGVMLYKTNNAVVVANLLVSNTARYGGGLYLNTDNTAVLTNNQVFFNYASSNGGGLYVRSSNVYVAHNQIMTNTSAGLGGGLYCYGGTPQYVQNTVSFNSTVNGGGGLYCAGGNPKFIENVLEFNTASVAVISYGGGMELDSTSEAQVTGNRLQANSARRGGGLYIRDSGAALVQSNVILSNTANLGGGVYVNSGLSTAGFLSNTIAFNTVSGSDNRGAGAFINGGASPWESNIIYSNTAQLRGGGIYVNTSSATFRNNRIVLNSALNSTDSGGGVYVLGGTVALVGNQILTNTTPGSGGGVYLSTVAAGSTLQQNIFVGNTAARGGGIYIYRGRPVLLGNRVLQNVSTNTTDGGGGIYISSNATQLISLVRNIVQGNQAQGWGGGLYVFSSVQDVFDGNVLFANTAQSDGGGIYLTDTTARLLNTVVADNVSVTGRGGGIYLGSSSVRWLHTTIARNADAYQVGVHLQSGSPVFTNTILISHTIGISVAQGAAVTFNATLWGNDTNASGPGSLVAYGPSVTGNPDFLAPDAGDYRIGPSSAALDAGVPGGVMTDMEGLSRPVHLGYDLGASEYRGTCFVRLNQSSYTYSSIQAAVDASNSPDDVVKVAGTCTGVHAHGALTQTLYLNKPLTLQGGYTLTQWLYSDPVAYPTTVDALSLGRVIYVAEGVTATVRGLRLRGGNAALGGGTNVGGGIYAAQATLTLEDVQIFNNQAANGGGVMADAGTLHLSEVQLFNNTAVNGGGLYADHAALRLARSQIFSNTADYGGGVYVYRSAAAQITRNTFHHNTATSGGGAMYLAQSPVDIASNHIFANTGARGGGLYLDASDARLVNSVIVDNTTNDLGSGIYINASSPRMLHLTIARNQGDGGSGLHLTGDSAAVITNTVLLSQTVGLNVEAGSAVTLTATYWGNGAWANGADWLGAGSVISQLNYYAGDPAFVAPQEQDYHITAASALINQGVLTEILDDLEGFPRDRWPDLGADEYRMCWVRLNDDPTDYTGVQEAVDAAQSGDVVKIAGRCGGVSARPRNDLVTTGLVTQVVYLTKTLTLQGGYTATNFTQAYPVTQPTVLDALGLGRVVYVAAGAQPTLSGLQLIGGDATGQGGHPTADAGGGLYAAHATVTVDACQFYDNVADVGGGIHVALGQAELRNVIIADNQALTGGALHMWESDLQARHTTLAQNNGIGVYLEQAGTAWLTNTILISHTIGITATDGITARLQATLWGNGLDWDTGNANIQTDADFWGNPAFVAPATYDYHLRGVSAAIDLGMDAGLTVDGDGKVRPVGLGYDLGADEFQAAFSLSKHVTPSLVLSGERITYTLALTNTGYLPLQVTIVDHLPEGGSPHGSLTWTPWLAPGEVWTQQLPVDVELGYVGPLTNTAFATATLGMVAQAEAVAQAAFSSDLAITKTATLEAAPAEWVTYTLAFRNIGASPAFNVVVSDTFPTMLESLNVTATHPITALGEVPYTWDLGTLGPNTGGFITVTGRVRTGISGGTAISNTATIAGLLIEENTSNNASGPVTTTVLNVAPLVVHDVITTAEDTPVLAAVLDNDIDLNGDTLSVVAVGAPQHGQTAILTATVLYTPSQDFYGADSFTYVVSDGVLTDTGTVSVTITPQNDPPVALDDAYATFRNQPLSISAPGVLGNDADVDGDTLTVTLVDTPTHGTATLNADGSFVYTPTAGFTGEDAFTYRAYDGVGYSAPATVSITITNRAPVAVDDAYQTYRNQPLNVAAPGVLANDSDADGDALTAALVSAPTHGTATLNADGSFVYTPTVGFTGEDAFTYCADDGLVSSNVATVTLTVTNRAPTAADDAYQTYRNQQLSVAAPGVLANDGDADGDLLTAALESAPTHGTVTLVADGSFVYTPTFGFTGAATFIYRACDGVDCSAPATVTITVANRAPTAADDAYLATTYQPLPIFAPGVLENDGDADGDPLTAVLVDNPTRGTVTLNADGSFVYTPTVGFTGAITFTYRTSDGLATSNVATVTISVTANALPVAVDDAYTTFRNQPLSVVAPAVLANDSDAENDPLMAILVAAPTHGTATLNANGSFVYTPTVGFAGEDTFTYRAYDGVGYSAPATVTVTVANRAPVAAGDTYPATSYQPLQIAAPGVLSNDSDADGDTLTAEKVSDPAHGTLVLAADGGFVYTATPGFSGVDAFTYRASDGLATSNVATVMITVTANALPVAVDDAYTTFRNQPLSVVAPGVLANDSDAENDPLMAILVSAPTHGTATLNANGSFVYTPTTDFVGEDAFTYRAYDGVGYSAPATVTITVTNRAPVAAGDIYPATSYQSLQIAAPGVLSNDSDADGDTLTAEKVSDPAHGTVVLAADGGFVYTAAPGFSGVDAFTYRASDGLATSNVATVMITVTANALPVAVDDAYATFRNQPLSVVAPGVLANDSDAENDPLMAILVSAPTHGTATLNADGSLVYTPTTGFVGEDAFTYRAYDGVGYSAPATVTITVTNRAPVAAGDTYPATIYQPLQIAAPGVLSNDSDADGDTLTAEKVSDPAHGTVVLAADGSFIYTATPGFSGVDAFTYRASDGLATSNVATVMITVTANALPVAVDDAYTTFRNQPLNLAAPGVLANDSDAENDPLMAILVSAPTHGTATLNANGSFVYTPTAGFAGVDTFTYRAYDGVGYSAPATVSITITNRAPTAADDAYQTYRNQPLNVVAPGVLDNDSDADGDALTAALLSAPTHGTATLNADGSFVYTPTVGFTGEDTFTYRAYDGVGYSAPATVSITITNRAPTAADDAYQTYRNQPLNVVAPGVLDNDSDADGDALTAALLSAPTHGTVTLNANGSFVYTPTTDFTGADTFTYRAYDGVGYSAPATVSITITNRAPTAADDAYQTYRNQPLSVAALGVLGNDSDADGDALTAALVAAPTHGTATLNVNGSFVYTPTTDFTGADTFTYRAYDGVDYSAPAMVTLTVMPTTEITYTLTISKVGEGTVVPSPGVHTYTQGTRVDLTATPASGWRFDRWSGDVSGTMTQTYVVMDGNKTVTATFVQGSYMIYLPLVLRAYR